MLVDLQTELVERKLSLVHSLIEQQLVGARTLREMGRNAVEREGPLSSRLAAPPSSCGRPPLGPIAAHW